MLGRRGPAQAAFTNPEVRELGELARADVLCDPAQVEAATEAATPTAQRNVELFRDYAQREPSGKSHRIELRFLRSPVEILGGGGGDGLRCRNRLGVAGRARRCHRRGGGDRVRPGAALDRLAAAAAASRSTSAAG